MHPQDLNKWVEVSPLFQQLSLLCLKENWLFYILIYPEPLKISLNTSYLNLNIYGLEPFKPANPSLWHKTY